MYLKGVALFFIGNERKLICNELHVCRKSPRWTSCESPDSDSFDKNRVSHLPKHIARHVIERIAKHVTVHIAAYVTAHVILQATVQITAHVATHVIMHVTSHVAAHANKGKFSGVQQN